MILFTFLPLFVCVFSYGVRTNSRPVCVCQQDQYYHQSLVIMMLILFVPLSNKDQNRKNVTTCVFLWLLHVFMVGLSVKLGLCTLFSSSVWRISAPPLLMDVHSSNIFDMRQEINHRGPAVMIQYLLSRI